MARNLPGNGYERQTSVAGTPEERAAKAAELLDLEKEVRGAARAAETPEDEARAADLLARLGDALRYTDLDIEEKNYDDVPVRGR